MQALRNSLPDRTLHLIVLALVLAGAASARTSATVDPNRWKRVHIEDSFTRAAVQWSLEGADQWLKSARCETLFSEFQDRQGRPLASALATLQVTAREYLHLVVFVDGSRDAPCSRYQTLAFTRPGDRVVRICGRVFERAWHDDATVGQVALLHETLHSLGLDENPPPSSFISRRIRLLCGRV